GNVVAETIYNGSGCNSPPRDICLVTAQPAPPPPAKLGHTLTFVNNCRTHAIWLAAYSQSPSIPLLCTPAATGSTTGDCAPDKIGGGPPPWGDKGVATWEIPAAQSRKLTVPFCYESAVFAA